MRSQHVRPALARLARGRRRPLVWRRGSLVEARSGAGHRLPPAAPQRAILLRASPVGALSAVGRGQQTDAALFERIHLTIRQR